MRAGHLLQPSEPPGRPSCLSSCADIQQIFTVIILLILCFGSVEAQVCTGLSTTSCHCPISSQLLWKHGPTATWNYGHSDPKPNGLHREECITFIIWCHRQCKSFFVAADQPRKFGAREESVHRSTSSCSTLGRKVRRWSKWVIDDNQTVCCWTGPKGNEDFLFKPNI